MKIKSGSIFRTVATTSSATVLAVSLAFSGSSVSAKSSDEFVPHKLVLGPIRLDMAKANNSGTINKDPLYIADRQAMMSMKIIPGVVADYAKPIVAQLIGAPWIITDDFNATKNVTVSIHSSKNSQCCELLVEPMFPEI